MKEYAVYKGEKLLEIGTVREIAKRLKVKEKTVYFWSMPSNHKRNKKNARIAIRLEEKYDKGRDESDR